MQEISYVKIFFVVLFGVFIANISSGTVIKYWIEYEATATVAMQETSEALRLSNEENRRKIAIQQQKNREKLARQSRKNIQRINNEVCQFWEKEYSKKQSNYNKIMREDSCGRVRSY